jgi:hypothetical protein
MGYGGTSHNRTVYASPPVAFVLLKILAVKKFPVATVIVR